MKNFLNSIMSAHENWSITTKRIEQRSELLWYVNLYPRQPIYVGCIDGNYFAVSRGFQDSHKWYTLTLEQVENFNRSEILRADKALKLAECRQVTLEARQRLLEERIAEKSTNVPDKLSTSLDALTAALIDFNKSIQSEN